MGTMLIVGGTIVGMVETANQERERAEINAVADEIAGHALLLRNDWRTMLTTAARLAQLAQDLDAAPPDTRNATLRTALGVAGPAFRDVAFFGPDRRLAWSAQATSADPIEPGIDGEIILGPLPDPVSARTVLRLLKSVPADGSRPPGVVSVVLDHQFLSAAHESANLDAHEFAGLANRDGRWLITSARPAPLAVPLPTGTNGADLVVFRGNAPIDGPAQIAAFAPLPFGGATVVVSTALDRVLAAQRDAAASLSLLAYLLATGLALLGLGIMAVLVYLDMRHNHRIAHAATFEREALLRQIGWHSSAMIALLDQDFTYLYVSPASIRLLGAPPAALVGRKAGGMVDGADRDRVAAAALAAATRREATHIPLHVTAPSGERRALDVRLTPLHFERPDVPLFRGLFMIVRDVTHEEAAAHTIQELRTDLELITRAGPGAIYHAQVHPDGSRVMAFPCGTGRFHLNLASGGDAYEAHVAPDDRAALRRSLILLQRDNQATVEYGLLGPGGTRFTVRDVSTVTVRHADSVQVAGYLIDVTRERQQQERLERARVLLSLGQMAVGLAHELNQPLAAITMAAENDALLLDQGTAGIDAARQKFDRVSALAMRAGDIIDQMRQFGRGGATRPEPTEIAPCLEAAYQVMSGRLERDRIAVTVDIPPARLLAAANPGLLQQVLVNLIANACDALVEARRTERRIALRARREGCSVVLSVSDNAGGIPAEVIGQVFEPFVTTKAPGKGTGLGLAVVFGIIQRFDGTITASNRDEGAVFEIRLPAWAEAAVTA